MSAETDWEHLASPIEGQDSAETRYLLPLDARMLLPHLGELEPTVDMIAQIKLTAREIPSWALYVAAFDGEDTLFGLWTSFYEVRFGYYSLSELASVQQHLEINVKRDEQFEPRRLYELAELHEASRQT
jgi:hypothetical protein